MVRRMKPINFSKKALITGAAGFVGSHLVEHILKNTDWEIVGLDRLDPLAHSNTERIDEVVRANPQFRNRFKWSFYDLKNPIDSFNPSSYAITTNQKYNYIFHLAASTHVDDSITNPVEYCNDNINGTLNLLEYARHLDCLEYFNGFSTDEVYGNVDGEYAYKEDDRYKPRNPYAAFKAGADHICYAYSVTHRLPIVISNCVNIIGEKQDTRKALPLFLKKILAGEKLYIHSYPGAKVSGARQYVHARNVAAAALFVNQKFLEGKIESGEKFNFPGQKQVSNLELAQYISNRVNKDLNYELVDFHSNRPGHDLLYRLDGSKLFEMGFNYPVDFDKSLDKTIDWYMNNRKWLND